MFKITSGSNTYYSDTLVPVKLAANGCYVQCAEAEAQGFCAKISGEHTDEDGKKITMLFDTVFRTGTLTGAEPSGASEIIQAAQTVTEAADMRAALDALGYKEAVTV